MILNGEIRLLDGEDHMSAGEQTYLIIAIGAFTLFALTLVYLDITTHKNPTS